MSTGLKAGTNNDGYLQVNGTDVLTALSSGSIGIGTDNPAQKLHVFGDTGTNIQVQQTNGNIYLGSSGNTRFGLSSGANVIQSTSVDFAIGSQSGNNLILGTDNLERLRITSIGTLVLNPNGSTGAGTLLDIFGGSPSGTRFGAIRIGDGTITGGHVNYWDIGRDNNINGNFTLALNGSEKACVDISGNVGIGTTNPSTKLDLYRAGSGVAGRFGKETIWGEFQVDGQRIGIQGTRSSDSAITGVYIENPSSSGTSNFNSVSIKTTGYERFRIETDGSQFSSQRYSGANDSYVRRSWRHFQSAFNNPTVDLATIIIGNINAGIAIYVRVVHIEYYGTAVSPGIISEGLASIKRESTIYTTYAGTMSVIKSATSSNVGTLSWNGQTLQYTPNRVANYDSYYVEFEAFGTLGNAHIITPSW